MPHALVPIPPFSLVQAGVNVNGLMDASAEKVAMIGRITWADADTSKGIRRVVTRLGAVTAGTATFRVSLQDVDTSAGPPGVPDGTPDQTWTTATSGLTANTVLETGDLSADRTVSKGDLFAVVCDYSAFTSGASVIVNNLPAPFANHLPSCALFTAAWATLANSLPQVAFIFADGTRGTFEGAAMIANTSAADYNNATTSTASLDSGDERGAKWVPTRPGTLSAIQAYIRVAGGTSDLDLAIYRDTTLVGSVTIEGNMVTGSGTYGSAIVPLATPIRFAPSDNLYLVVKPTTANNLRVIAIDFHAAGDLSLTMDGEAVSWAQRADAGAWVSNTGADLRVGAVFPLGEFDEEIAAGSYALSGTVTNASTGVTGATVTVIDRVTGLTKQATTDGSGDWTMSVESNAADRYAAYAEYENGGNKYRALAPWSMTAA